MTTQAPARAATLRRKALIGFALLLAVTNMIWAAQPTTVKYVQPFLGPFAIAFLPFYIITPLLLPLLWWNRRANPAYPRPTAADWRSFIIAGVGGQIVAQLGITWGSLKGQASSCSILYLLVPVLTAVMASFMLRERITLLRVFCLGVGLAGVLIMSANDLRGAQFLASDFFLGNMLFLGGCVGASFYNVYCKGLMRRFHERDVLIYSYITASPASLVFLLWLEPDCFRRLATLDAGAWTALAFNTLLVYGVSMLMLFYVLQFLPVTVVLASTYLIPVFGVLIAMILLGERPGPTTLAGGAVVLTATALIMKYDSLS